MQTLSKNQYQMTDYKIKILPPALPNSWLLAAGILRSKKTALEKHLIKVRKEWSR